MTKNETGSFYSWMIDNFLDKNNRFGDLARDMNEDYSFPHDNDFDAIIDYLVFDCGAAEACVDVFRECWKKYQEALVYA